MGFWRLGFGGGGVGGTGKCPQLISWGVYQAGSAAMAFVSQEWEKEGEGWSRNGNNLISTGRIWQEIFLLGFSNGGLTLDPGRLNYFP